MEDEMKLHLCQLIAPFFDQVATFMDITLPNFADFAGVSPWKASGVFAFPEWEAARSAWYRKRLLQAMDTLYQTARFQEDFAAAKIRELSGIPHGTFDRYIRDEWNARKATLPTMREKVTATLQSLVDANVPLKEFTIERVFELAGVSANHSWFLKLYRRAYLELAGRQSQVAVELPAGANIREIPGGWIDLDGDVWDMRPAGLHVLRRARIRSDIGDVIWPLLREELRSGGLALRTVDGHYQKSLQLSTLFAEAVPDVRRATKDMVERAWVGYGGTQSQRVGIRPLLWRLFEALTHLAEHDRSIDRDEMLRMTNWFRDRVRVATPIVKKDFLSESEVKALIRCCFDDIAAGVEYVSKEPDLFSASLRAFADQSAAPVALWAIALSILLMVFTGLRRQSVLMLKIDDWAEIQAGLYGIVWRHNKKGEENIAILPAPLAQQLQLYVRCTAPVRTKLNTEIVFLGSRRGGWGVLYSATFNESLSKFVQRHHLERDGTPLPLGSTVSRRTYSTRALYEGTNPEALRLQLGHYSIKTTLGYIQFDQFEHPAEVRDALEEYGRKALTPWQQPVLLDQLSAEERASLLGAGNKHDVDVGRCRHDTCVKAKWGSPPPCSLCEHLVTGLQFLPAWKAEHEHRRRALRVLASKPGSEIQLAQMKFQFDCFEANFEFVQARCGK